MCFNWETKKHFETTFGATTVENKIFLFVEKNETVETYPFLVEHIKIYLCGVRQTIFLKMTVATAEKVETNLNWIEQSRKLFFVGLRKSKHTENGQKVEMYQNLGSLKF